MQFTVCAFKNTLRFVIADYLYSVSIVHSQFYLYLLHYVVISRSPLKREFENKLEVADHKLKCYQHLYHCNFTVKLIKHIFIETCGPCENSIMELSLSM